MTKLFAPVLGLGVAMVSLTACQDQPETYRPAGNVALSTSPLPGNGPDAPNYNGSESEPFELTVMTYNVHDAIGMDRNVEPERISGAIVACDPDLVAVQEADSCSRRYDYRNMFAEMNEGTNLLGYYCPTIVVDDEGGKYGIGMMTRTEPVAFYNYDLPGKQEARKIFIAEYPDFFFASTHFSYVGSEALESAKIVAGLVEKLSKPMILGGDFNSRPGSAAIDALTGKFTIVSQTSMPTYPADNPVATLDYIMVYDPWGTIDVIHSETVDEPMASDHRPVVARLRLTPRPTASL